MTNQFLLWTGFNLFVVVMLVLDQKVFHKRSHEVSMKEALGWSAFWIVLAFIFNVGIYYWQGPKPAVEFLTGYLIELSLSIDNLFVFIVIFAYFKVPRDYQHKVLFWGIVGAQILRAVFILAGVNLIERFHWLIYLFGVFLIIGSAKMFTHKDEDIHPEQNPIFKLCRKVIPTTPNYDGEKFFVRQNNRWIATPLFLVLVVIDITDLVFAVDSVPAVLAITLNSFIVYTSNIFAILGLRSFYFVLARVMQLFHYLHYGLAVILGFVGVKMLLADLYKIPTGLALGVVVGTLLISIFASLVWPEKKPQLKNLKS